MFSSVQKHGDFLLQINRRTIRIADRITGVNRGCRGARFGDELSM